VTAIEDPSHCLLTISYCLTEKEAASSVDAANRANSRSENSRFKYWALVTVLLVLLGVGVYAEVRERGYAWIGIVAIIFVPVYVTLRRRSRARRSEAMKPVTLEVRGDGLTFINSNHRSALRWSSFSRLAETTDFFLLHVSRSSSWRAVPKRAFATGEQADWFGHAVNEQIRSAAVAARIAGPPLSSAEVNQADGQLPISFPARYTFGDCLGLLTATWAFRIGVTFLVGSYVVILMSPRDPADGMRSDWLTALTAAIPFAIMILGLTSIITVRTRAVFQREQYIDVLLTEEGVTLTGPHGEHVCPWETYQHFFETRGAFLIWRDAWREQVLVPKRCIRSQGIDQRLRELLEMRLGPPIRPVFLRIY
jgi:hypothetical protein